MAFNDYLNALDTAIRAGGNFRAALIDQAPDRTSPPTQDQLISFLSKLRFALQLETKAGAAVAKDAGQVGRRDAAIAEIETFVQNPSAPIVFTHIDRNLFAFQLALRVRSPRIINQDNTTLCGPVALVYDIAKRDPQRYVRFAISLFSAGTAMFGLTQVTPSETIRNGYRANLLPEADYVVLASVRDTDSIVIETDMLRHILTLTKPGALAEFLRRAGYRNIQDHTFLNLSVPLMALNAVTPFNLHGLGHNPLDRGEQNLREAIRELNAGRFIVMNAEGAVSGAIVRGTTVGLGVRGDPLPAGETHWTAIRKLSIAGNNVQIKIITWGGSYEGTLAKDALLSRYAGYVSADP